MFCQKCGTKLISGALFCSKCGTKVPAVEDFENAGSETALKNRADFDNNRLTSSIVRFQKGETDSFDIIYNESKKYIYYTILKSVGDKDVADDILQDTYIEIYKSLGQLQTPEAFKGWAAKIAQHRISKYYQKRNPELFSTEEEMDDTVGDIVEDDMSALPEDAMINKEVQRLISEIIDELPQNQKSAVISFFYNQMSISEIAESMGVPENTVKTYLFRGKKKIKDGVLEIEKKHGTKLYALPIAGLLGLVFTEEAKAAVITVSSTKILGKISPANDFASMKNPSSQNTFDGVDNSAKISGKGTQAVSAVTKAAGGLSSSAIRTIAICATAGLLVGGGTTAAVLYNRSNVPDAYEEEFDDSELPAPIPDRDEKEYSDNVPDNEASVTTDNEEIIDDGGDANISNEVSDVADIAEIVDEETDKNEKEEEIYTAEEQKYVDEADEFLKQDDPLSAAEVLTKAMMEGYYPELYEKLKDIRRNTVDNNTHIVQYEENTGNLIYEASLETVYDKDIPVGTKEYEIAGGKKTLVNTEDYSDAENGMPNNAKVEYDTDGRVSVVSSKDDKRTYKYDDYGRLISQQVSRTNAFGTWITVFDYKYTEKGCIVSGHDISADGSDLGYENTEEKKYDALGGAIKSKSHWDEEGEIYGGWAEWTHEYHYVPELKRTAPENPNSEEIWNDWPGDDLVDILYM